MGFLDRFQLSANRFRQEKTMRSTAIVLIVSQLTLGAPAFAQEATSWQRVAEAIPLGSRIKVETLEGKRFSATLMRVDSKEMLVKPNTRRPVPAVPVAFDDVAKIERHKDGGVNVAKAIAIGASAGAGAILTLILFAMQLD
jgi:hypothetical protein